MRERDSERRIERVRAFSPKKIERAHGKTHDHNEHLQTKGPDFLLLFAAPLVSPVRSAADSAYSAY